MNAHVCFAFFLNEDVQRVVLIAHSQGTIIVAQALAALRSCGLDQIRFVSKLEIYAIANGASDMQFLVRRRMETTSEAMRYPNDPGNNYPHLESLANSNDLVARLGCTARKEVKLRHDAAPRLAASQRVGHRGNSACTCTSQLLSASVRSRQRRLRRCHS